MNCATTCLRSIPLSFQPNQGQSAPEVRFLAKCSGYNLFLTDNEAVLSLRRPAENPDGKTDRLPPDVIRLKLVATNQKPKVLGTDKLSGKVNYLIGNAPEKWHKNIPTYAKVRYREIYPGVDMVLYGNGGRFEYDFVVAPGADPGLIALDFEGIGDLKLDEKGNLELSAGSEQLTMHKPFVYQETDGATKEIEGSFVLKGKNQIGFQLGKYDESKPLVIDPVLTLNYSTYLGGTADEESHSIAIDFSGCAYVTGSTSSSNFPTQGAIQSSNAGISDVFITKLNTDGSALVYSTYLGGASFDYGRGIAVDSTGCAYVTGYTDSDDFPTQGAIQSSNAGDYDAFVTKLNTDGSALVYSTYLGGTSDDNGFGIAVDLVGCAYVTGSTSSSNFPTQGAIQSSNAGSTDVFITKLNTDGSALVYSTYLGGTSYDNGSGIAVDSSGCAYVTGDTSSEDFPTQGAIQPSYSGNYDAFVTKLNTDGSALVYSTYLGGTSEDTGRGIAVDPSGCAYVAGYTYSENFPTQGAIQSSNAGSSDVFITKLNTDGSALVYSTYLGGASFDYGRGIVVDSSGCAYVTGYTYSENFPTQGAIQSSNAGISDVFVTKLNTDGSALVYSTYLGGTSYDHGSGIAVDSGGRAYVTGSTGSENFPTKGAFQSSKAGAGDAFIFKLTADDPVSRGFDFFHNFSSSDENKFNIRISGPLS